MTYSTSFPHRETPKTSRSKTDRSAGRKNTVDTLVGESAVMRTLKQNIQKVLQAEDALTHGCPPAILLTGETGTGKNRTANVFHFAGRRKNNPFVEINCATSPGYIVETKLFGHRNSALKNTHNDQPGILETADTGTLFLDEIGDMDLSLQVKILALIEEKSSRYKIDSPGHRAGVRIIAASSHDLVEKVRQQRFRPDLLFRLRVLSIHLPPLRERYGDVDLLADYFLSRYVACYGKNRLDFSDRARALLNQYNWPGNVRELRNVIEQAALLSDGYCIEKDHLDVTIDNNFNHQAASNIPAEFPEQGFDLKQVEIQLLKKALNETGGNVTRAANLLGLTRDTLRYRIGKYEIRVGT